MALDAEDLYNDIVGDADIMDDIPAAAVSRFEEVMSRLAVHITAQINRGVVDDVTVDGEGNQTGTASVK